MLQVSGVHPDGSARNGKGCAVVAVQEGILQLVDRTQTLRTEGHEEPVGCRCGDKNEMLRTQTAVVACGF